MKLLTLGFYYRALEGIDGVLTKIFLIKFILIIATAISFTYFGGYKLAILIMIAVAWHETGHVWAMNKVGISNYGWYSVPFLGGISIPKEQYKSYYQHAIVFLMGPTFGVGMALLIYMFSAITHSPILGMAAFWVSVLNLFNLVPIVPLDGGQAIKSLLFSFGRKIGFVYLIISLVGLFYGMIHYKIWLAGLLILSGLADFLLEILKSFRRKFKIMNEIVMQSHMNLSQSLIVFAWYLAVSIILFAIVKSTIIIPEILNSKFFI